MLYCYAVHRAGMILVGWALCTGSAAYCGYLVSHSIDYKAGRMLIVRAIDTICDDRWGDCGVLCILGCLVAGYWISGFA